MTPSKSVIYTGDLALYHLPTCWFCMLVRHTIDDLGIDVELRNIAAHEEHRAALISGGGRATVPCLRVESDDGTIEWMYESARIRDYLNARFGTDH